MNTISKTGGGEAPTAPCHPQKETPANSVLGTAAQRLAATPLGDAIDGIACCAVSDPIEKCPISMYGLCLEPGIAYFASTRKERDWTDLRTLSRMGDVYRSVLERERGRISDPRYDNVCINITEDLPVVCLDLERSCPREIIAWAIGSPEALYSGVSLSGKGVHVWIRRDAISEILTSFPGLLGKSVWRAPLDPDGNCPFELLVCNHCATETAIPILNPPASESILPLLERLAAVQPRKGESHVDDRLLNVGDVRGGAALTKLLTSRLQDWRSEKSGLSERDAAYATRVARELWRMNTDLDCSEQVAVVTDATAKLLAGVGLMRDKWHEVHYYDGASYGEGTARSAVALVLGTAEEPRRWRFTMPFAEAPDELDVMCAAAALRSLGASDDSMEQVIIPSLEACYGELSGDLAQAAMRFVAVPVETRIRAKGGTRTRRRPWRSVAAEVVREVERIGIDRGVEDSIAQAVVGSYGIDGWTIEDTRRELSSMAALRGEAGVYGDDWGDYDERD